MDQVSRSKLDTAAMSSREVEEAVRGMVGGMVRWKGRHLTCSCGGARFQMNRFRESGESVFEVDAQWLREKQPDLIFTQVSGMEGGSCRGLRAEG